MECKIRMSPFIFNRTHVHQHRLRALRHFAQHDFLAREAYTRIRERLDDIVRIFPRVLQIGMHGQYCDHPKIGTIVAADYHNHYFPQHAAIDGVTTHPILCDDEYLPFAEASFDAVFSVMHLHWVNDVPGTLRQIQHVLKADGLFVAVFPGGHTLMELREAMTHASIEMQRGISPHLSPMIDVRDAGNLLQRAGFALPVAESDMLHASYEHAFALLHDIRGMGQTNALLQRNHHCSPRALFMRMAEHYNTHYKDDDGRITATCELLTLTAWKPDASQQQPAARGSGKISLANALGHSS